MLVTRFLGQLFHFHLCVSVNQGFIGLRPQESMGGGILSLWIWDGIILFYCLWFFNFNYTFVNLIKTTLLHPAEQGNRVGMSFLWSLHCIRLHFASRVRVEIVLDVLMKNSTLRKPILTDLLQVLPLRICCGWYMREKVCHRRRTSKYPETHGLPFPG